MIFLNYRFIGNVLKLSKFETYAKNQVWSWWSKENIKWCTVIVMLEQFSNIQWVIGKYIGNIQFRNEIIYMYFDVGTIHNVMKMGKHTCVTWNEETWQEARVCLHLHHITFIRTELNNSEFFDTWGKCCTISSKVTKWTTSCLVIIIRKLVRESKVVWLQKWQALSFEIQVSNEIGPRKIINLHCKWPE